MKSSLNIKEALKKYHKIEIELLLAYVLKKPKEFLYLYPAHELTQIQADRLTRMVQRRMRGEPVAYILGYKDFWGLRFKVNRNVLIPRSDTEIIVEKIISDVIPEVLSASEKLSGIQSKLGSGSRLSAALGRDDTIRILDVGTGSGNIIISLAKAFMHNGSHCEMGFYASDVSKKALAVAKQNAQALGVKVKFIQSDLLKNVKGNFDIIVANLPYVPESDFRFRIKDLRFEPKNAIFAKENGLEYISKLLKQIATRKVKPKLIFLEFDPRQKFALSSAIKKYLPKAEIKFYKDCAGLWRCAEIKLNFQP